MIINHNISSMFANRQIGINELSTSSSMEKLSSGKAINKAGDDASGLAVSTKMNSQIRGLNMANKNVQNGISFIQTTEGYLDETTNILQRIRELSVQSANGIYTDEDRAQISVEVSSLVSEIDRIASQAQFNGMNMLTGRFAEEGINFQIGANMDQNVNVKVSSATASALNLKNGETSISVATADDANATIGTVDEALKAVNKQRADLGAYQNRFETASKGIANAAENLTASVSRIEDTDMAKEMVEFTKDQVLTQASTAMLAQANNNSMNVLKIIG